MKDYSYFDSKKILKELKTSLNGLSNKEANNRLKRYGLNELPKEKEKTIWASLIRCFFDIIINAS